LPKTREVPNPLVIEISKGEADIMVMLKAGVVIEFGDGKNVGCAGLIPPSTLSQNSLAAQAASVMRFSWGAYFVFRNTLTGGNTLFGAGGGSRTLTSLLSPVRLPVSPPGRAMK
jgi:hypothetical protein